VFRPKVGSRQCSTWWLDYSVNLGGRSIRHRESSHTASRKEALDLLHSRVGDRRAGKLIGRPDRVLLAEYTTGADGKRVLSGGLRWLHETQYDLDGRRSKERVQQCWNRIEKFFPTPTPVTAVSEVRLDEYARARLAAGAARATVNNELSALRRGFNLAIKKKLLARGAAPEIELPNPDNARSGFFDTGDLAAVLMELPAYCRVVIRFLEATGWRVNEALRLTWDRIDWERQGIRLSARATKGKAPRLFPFGLAPDLKALLDAAWTARNGLFVFQGPRAGQPLGYTTLLHHWQGATKRAGCAERIIHDLRRTAVQAFIDAGVDEQTIMDLAGMRTRSIFQRYLIVRQQRLDAAVAKRFAPANGKQAANTPGTGAPAGPLS